MLETQYSYISICNTSLDSSLLAAERERLSVLFGKYNINISEGPEASEIIFTREVISSFTGVSVYSSHPNKKLKKKSVLISFDDETTILTLLNSLGRRKYQINLEVLHLQEKKDTFDELRNVERGLKNLSNNVDLSTFSRSFEKLIKQLEVLKYDFSEDQGLLLKILKDDFQLTTLETFDDRRIYENLEDYRLLRISTSGDKFFIYRKDQKLSFLQSFAVFFISFLYQKREHLTGLRPHISDELKFLEKVTSHIPFSTCMLDSAGDVVVYNPLFTELRIFPSELIKLSDGETIEHENNVYKISRYDLELENETYYSFIIESISEIPSHEEAPDTKQLGIISSSVAHELNNPIAGILAALSLIKLEDDLPDDFQETLLDMEHSAKRCKELIDVFLGFSKKMPLADTACRIRSSFDQAMNLGRFRMIESNVRFDFDYNEQAIFGGELNKNLLSMIFYILFTEILTEANHFRLLRTQKGDLVLKIKGTVTERENSIVVEIEGELDLSKKLLSLKLLKHLFDISRLEVSFETGRIIMERK